MAVVSTLAIVIYAFGSTSGGVFNPAVAIGLAMRGAFSWIQFALWSVMEILGAFVAVMLYQLAIDKLGETKQIAAPEFKTAGPMFQQFGVEWIITFVYEEGFPRLFQNYGVFGFGYAELLSL